VSTVVKRRLAGLWHNWVQPLLAVALVLGSFRSAIADWNDVPTGSMKPTILEGDRVFVNKAAYDLRVPFTHYRLRWWASPHRGDIVVFDSPYDGKRLVKRVVAVPGDTLEMRGYRLIVNGEPAHYERVHVLPHVDLAELHAQVAYETSGGHTHLIMAQPQKPSITSFDPIVVPPGRYVVMGDNRDNSFDSRWFGYVSRERIVGEVTAVVLSFDREHHFLPRWDRFLTSLD
jgi:signal peptidase I